MEQWHQLYGDKMMTVRYENLASGKDDVVNSLFAFAGVKVLEDLSVVQLNKSRIGIWKNYKPELKHVIEAFHNVRDVTP